MQVQLDIRTGHAQTVDKVLGWLDGGGGVAGITVCDCGCGTGSLAVPLALRVRLWAFLWAITCSKSLYSDGISVSNPAQTCTHTCALVKQGAAAALVGAAAPCLTRLQGQLTPCICQTAHSKVGRGSGGKLAPPPPPPPPLLLLLLLMSALHPAQGAEVTASDISSAMADEARRRYEAAVASSPQQRPKVTISASVASKQRHPPQRRPPSSLRTKAPDRAIRSDTRSVPDKRGLGSTSRRGI